MRRTFAIILLLSAMAAAPLRANAQKLESFKHRLAEPAFATGARVTATEHAEAAQAVAQAERMPARSSFRGYRICIFLDNGQNARAEALRAKLLFEETCPGTAVYLTYENPYWRVTAGNCLTTEEAIMLKGRIAPNFPKAFIKNQELTLSDLLH